MEQIVTVKALFRDGTALVQCRRTTACSGNCTQCGGCAEAEPQLLEVRAKNSVGAKTGDRVVVVSATGQILGAAAAVYLLPLLLLFAGYFLAGPWGAVIGIAIGVAGIVALDRCRAGKKKTMYTITAFARE